VHLGIWALLQQIPVEESVGNLDMASIEGTTTHAETTSQDDATQKPQEDDGNDQGGGSGAAMALESGKMGSNDSQRVAGQFAMKKTSEDPQLAREEAKEEARKAGILGDIALAQGAAFTSMTSAGEISSGFDDHDVYGGLEGTEVGEMNGGFGNGRWGFGPGGGGKNWGTIGTGDYGLIGHAGGRGDGYTIVDGHNGSMRRHTSSVPPVTFGQPEPNGDLDAAIIRRYILRNRDKIQYCYEKQLLLHPALAGTVQAQFFITPNGNVAMSKAAGVDAEVASCVADVIHQVEFPKPKGGGGVQVNYPFTFRPANGQ
jgi:hypothetical protein